MAVSVGITLLFLFFYVTLATHRMAGGDISNEVRLRKKDEFKHLANEVDLLKVSLGTKIR